LVPSLKGKTKWIGGGGVGERGLGGRLIRNAVREVLPWGGAWGGDSSGRDQKRKEWRIWGKNRGVTYKIVLGGLCEGENRKTGDANRQREKHDSWGKVWGGGRKWSLSR